LACRSRREAGSARPHDVTAARELLRHELPALARVRAIVGDAPTGVSPGSPAARA
jgi:hypothetical protein